MSSLPEDRQSLMFPTQRMRSKNNKWLTNALFAELCTHGTEDVIFTLTDENSPEGYQSFPNIYFALTDSDPTEYTFAMTVFGSWEHWLEVSTTSKLVPYMKKLRTELNIRQKSKAVAFILNEVESKGKNSYQAAKLLLEKPWADKVSGRTKAAEDQREADAREDRAVYAALTNDAEKLGLLDKKDLN